MRIHSHCKVNLLLNILGKRPDGFHELETLMHPLALCDVLEFEKASRGITLRCSIPELPTDSGNIVYRAAALFFETARITDGVRISLEKMLPLAAGLGGGSGNAACTLSALNRLFDSPLSEDEVHRLAASLGSDVPFFLQKGPALAFGRGEIIEPVGSLKALQNSAFLVVHPGFGISTPWSYQSLARFPEALNGRKGRARSLVTLMQTGTIKDLNGELYNSLEAPALEKFPLLVLFQEFFRENGAVTLMSGSGSSTFAITTDLAAADLMAEKFKEKFGAQNWIATVPCAARVSIEPV